MTQAGVQTQKKELEESGRGVGAITVLLLQYNHIFISGAWAAVGRGVCMGLIAFYELFTELQKCYPQQRLVEFFEKVE